jgi:hypothetical protein
MTSCFCISFLQIQDTKYVKKTSLTFTLKAQHSLVYFAYAPIYGYEDHLNFLASLSNVKTTTPFTITAIGMSPKKRPIDLVTIGEGCQAL